MRRLATALTAAGLAGLAVPAAADALVQVDRGIAGARLDNTRAQVRAALGKPSSTERGTNEFGRFLVFHFRGGITVTFQGRTRVTGVDTTGVGDRTATGVGVGSTRAQVRAGVKGVTCETIGSTRICHTGALEAGRRVTTFLFRSGKVTRVTVGFVID
jgi:hypothetical protein